MYCSLGLLGVCRLGLELFESLPQVRRDKVKEVAQLPLEETSDRLRVLLDVVPPHKLEPRNLDQFSETDHQSPGVRLTGLESLQENR